MDGDDEYEQDFEREEAHGEGGRKIQKPRSRSYSSRKEIEIKNQNIALKKKEIIENSGTNRSSTLDDPLGVVSKVSKHTP